MKLQRIGTNPDIGGSRVRKSVFQHGQSGTTRDGQGGLAREGSASQTQESFWSRECRGYREIFCHPMLLLVIFVPLGFMGRILKWNSLVVFAVNFLAILPMANMQFFAIEALSLHVSPLVGGLTEAFLGKSVEQVMAIQCLRAGLPEVLKSNLMGSMHWCLLLVLGMSIVAAGVKQKTCRFNVSGAAAQMSIQVVAGISITLPTMFGSIAGVHAEQVLFLSRICAVFLMFLYAAFVMFHLVSHKDSFTHDEQPEDAVADAYETTETGDTPRPRTASEDSGADVMHKEALGQLSLPSAVALMVVSITITSLNSEVLVDHIEEVSTTFGLPKQFIGAALLPILGNTAEHVASVKLAMANQMDLAISIAIGSATQIALFVVPLAVLWGWAFDEPMSLNFSVFDAGVMLLGTFLAAQVLAHGATNWLHGAMLMTVYLLATCISYFLPPESHVFQRS